MNPIFGYHINLDERGDFYADVRNEAGETVFEILAGISLEKDETSIFEDGFMRDKEDVKGLEDYLKSLSIIPADGELLSEPAFEQEQERRQQAADARPSEEELIDYMRHRIEDGDLLAEDVPKMLARYGMMEPEAFLDEMQERMQMAKEEAAEADAPQP